MKLHKFVAGVGMVLAPLGFAAENIQLAEVYSPGLAEAVVVTASRAPQALEDTLASTTLITREQIEKSQARDLYQLLRTVPGVSLKRSGGPGSTTSLSMRGGDSSGTLVLLDGVNIESATLGQVALQQISIDQIERIEIVRGPRSSLYGASAMSGVVQIFTRKSAAESGVTYSLGHGSHNTREGVFNASGVSATSRYNLSASHVSADGFDAQNLDDELASSPRFGKDDDGYRRSAISANVEQDMGRFFTGSVILNRSEGQADYDSPFSPDTYPASAFDTMLAATALKFETGPFMSRLQYSRLEDTAEDIGTGADFIFETNRDKGAWENSLQASDWLTVNFGMDYTHDAVVSTENYSQTKRDNFGGYANYRIEFSPVTWTLGMRHDNNEQFGSKWTGDTAVGFEIVDGVVISSSYGTGFKAPSFNDLYYPSQPWGVGNIALRPEETESYEIGLDVTQDWGVASAHVYKSKLDDLIEWQEVAMFFFQPFNVNAVDIRGLELQYGTRWLGVDMNASFTYEKVRNEDVEEDLAFKPRRRAALDLDKSLGSLDLGMTFYVQSHQFEDAFPERVRLGGYGQLDLRAAWQASKEIRLRTRLNNILDNDYAPQEGFNNEGRFLMFFVDYTPQ